MKNRLQRFFDKRSPRHNRFGLGFGTIYVFASRQGGLFLGLLIITFIAGVNYGNNLILGLFFYLLSIWLVSAVLTFLQLLPLQFELDNISLAPANSLLWVQFHITTTAKISRQIELSFYPLTDKAFDDNAIAHLSDSEKLAFLTHKAIILPQIDGKISVRLPVLTSKRGIVVLPRLNIKSTYPLGVVQAWSYGFFADSGFAYPAPLAFDETQKAKSASLDDNNSQFYQKGQDDFDQLDSYKEGESLSRVSWGHLARGAGMLTKHFADPVGQNDVIDYATMPATTHEDKLSQMAYALLQLQSTGASVQMKVNGVAVSGVGDGFIDECLLILAKEP